MEQRVKQNQLEKIRHFLKMGYYDSSVKECCGIMEDILKSIYRQALSELPMAERTALMEAESAIGRGVKGYTEFGFGQLVAVFNRCRLLDAWAKHSGRKLGLIKSISLDYIVELRNQLTHGGGEQLCGRSDAQLVYDCLMSWLAFIGYNELEHGISRAFEREPEESVPSRSPLPRAETARPAFERHAEYMEKRTTSSYRSDAVPERRRLKIQSRYSEQSDDESFCYALQRIGQKEKLCGLDIGCADGFVTESRFKEEYGFSLVVGVDHNKALMEKQSSHGIFHYHYLNVEAPDFEDEMEELLEAYGIDGFDVVFIALTLHHLKNPERFLRKLRPFIHKGGAIILRGVDDGALVSFGDKGLVEKVIEESIETKNMSDRFHARKFYSMLRAAGFEDIKMKYAVNDTVGISPEEKDVLFRYYFKFRSDYTKRQLATDPDNAEYIKKHEQMMDDLDELQDLFLRPDFFFLVMTITAIAIR